MPPEPWMIACRTSSAASPTGYSDRTRTPRPARRYRPPQVPRRVTPRQNHALENGHARIGSQEVRVDLLPSPEAAALLARTVGRVEGELTRLQLGEAGAAVVTGVVLAEHVGHGSFVAFPCSSTSMTPSPARSAVSTESAMRSRSALDHEPVDHDGDVVVLVAVERRRIVRSCVSPSTRTRTKPSFRAFSKSSRNSPFGRARAAPGPRPGRPRRCRAAGRRSGSRTAG